MILVTVLQLTARVKNQLSPCPGSPGVAQWHLGLPHLRKRPVNCPGRRSNALNFGLVPAGNVKLAPIGGRRFGGLFEAVAVTELRQQAARAIGILSDSLRSKDALLKRTKTYVKTLVYKCAEPKTWQK